MLRRFLLAAVMVAAPLTMSVPAATAGPATAKCPAASGVKVSAGDSPATISVTDTRTARAVRVVVTITGTRFAITAPPGARYALSNASWCVKSATKVSIGTGLSGTSPSRNKNNVIQDIGYVRVYSVTTAAGTPSQTLDAGAWHTCAVRSGGTVKCWGDNDIGQLGNGTTTNSTVPVMVTGLTGATAITAGGLHTCALLSNGRVKCWGYNGQGQIGNGTTTEYSMVPVPVTGLTGVTAITAGYQHTCALLNSGTVRCWGYNFGGQLGNGTTTDSPVPVTVTGLAGVTAITAGVFHTCALLNGGTMKCWGYNYYGQLGNGTTANSTVPVTVTGLAGVTAITAHGHTCALLSGGTLRCWGYNGYGQLGNGTFMTSSVPVTVTGLTGAAAITAGGSHTCALLGGGTMKCWGQNYEGQLGNGTLIPVSEVPVTVTGLTRATAITAGGWHACALLSGGTVKCWGSNYDGQLGNGTTTDSTVPVTVIGLP